MKKWKLLLLFPFLLFACQEEPEPIPVHPSDHLPLKGGSGETLAQVLSVNMGLKATRDFIKNEIVRKFDGDYNFLLALHSEELIDGEMTLGELFENGKDPGLLSELLGTYPLLQLAMPSLGGLTAEDWDTDTEIPVVVFRPPDADLTKMTSIPAYRNGNRVELDLTREPDELILVISNNERTVAVPKEKPSDKILPFGLDNSCLDNIESVGSNNTLTYYLIKSIEECNSGGGTSSGDGDSGTEGCDRDRIPGRDYISRAKFTTMNYMREAEHYLDGNPELYFIVTLASKNPSGFASLRKSYPSRDRSQWKDCGIFSCVPEWHEYNQPVFDWDPEIFGNLVRYDWFEEDFSTAKIDITLGLTSKFENVSVSGNVKITISKKDYFLDQDFVNYCDQTSYGGSDYNTGKLYFSVTAP